MLSSFAVLLGLGLLAPRAQERAPGVQRLVFELEVDLALAREQGWAAADASDERVVEVAARLVQRRFDAMQRAARVELTPGTKRFSVSLPSIDARDRELSEALLNSIGLCEFLIGADEESARARGIDFLQEQIKLIGWTATNPDVGLETFNQLDGTLGPARGIAWFPTRFRDETGPPLAVLLPESLADHVGAASFERVYRTQNANGDPAIGFELSAQRVDDLARVTEAHVGRRIAILFGQEVVLAPKLEGKLEGGGIIDGQLGPDDVEYWLSAFRARKSPLRVVAIR